MSTASFVLAAAQLLAPGRDHTVLSTAIAARVDAEAPLFKGDVDKKKSAAWLVAIGFRESSLRNDITSKTADHCAFQIHLIPGEKTTEGWSAADLRSDADKCVAVAFRMLRTSMWVCGAHPVAWYAEGPKGCASERAQRISRDRLNLSRWLFANVVTEKST